MAAGSHGGRQGSAWPPAMEVVVAQSQLRRRGRGEGTCFQGKALERGRRSTKEKKRFA